MCVPEREQCLFRVFTYGEQEVSDVVVVAADCGALAASAVGGSVACHCVGGVCARRTTTATEDGMRMSKRDREEKRFKEGEERRRR